MKRQATYSISPGCNGCEISSRKIKTTSSALAALNADSLKIHGAPVKIDYDYDEMSWPQRFMAAVQFAGGVAARGCDGMVDGVCPNRDAVVATNLVIAKVQENVRS